jgi:hypothetical protein
MRELYITLAMPPCEVSGVPFVPSKTTRLPLVPAMLRPGGELGTAKTKYLRLTVQGDKRSRLCPP